MLKYHPIRYREYYKPIINSVYEELKSYNGEVPSGLMATTIFGQNIKPYIKNSIQSHYDVTLEALLNYYEELFDAYTDYLMKGENIFHFKPELIKMFQNSDVENAILSDIKLPYKSFYIHFGQNSGILDKKSNSLLDGAYVSYSIDSDLQELFITLTFSSSNINYDKYLSVEEYLLLDNHFYFLLAFENDMTVEDAVDLAISDEEKNIENERRSYIEYNKWKSKLSSIVNLIINSLFYLSYEKNDVVKRYVDVVPESMHKKLKKSQTQREIKRNKSKIESLGFRKVHYCGDSIKKTTLEGHTEKEVSTHWRRGHWRSQPYGKNNKKRKLIWIKPTIVRPDKGSPDIKHIYEVEDD